jgi:hypothetical protein
MVTSSSSILVSSGSVTVDESGRETAGSAVVSIGAATPRNPVPSLIDDILARIESLLNSGLACEALRRLGQQRYVCPAFENARAVCLMHLGKEAEAVRILEYLLESMASEHQPVPPVYLLNLATALALTGEAMPARLLVRQLKLQGMGSRRLLELENSLNRWEESLSMWEQFQLKHGATVHHPVMLSFPPGELA